MKGQSSHDAPMRIALVEDDPNQAQLLTNWLGEAGYPARSYGSGIEFLKSVARESYDLLILDWALPDLDGMEVLNRYRSIVSDRPGVMVVTVREEEDAAVEALQHGADDYVRKPVRVSEFLARVKALGRRTAQQSMHDTEPFQIDPEQRVIRLNGEPVQLTAREFELALFLFQRRDQLLSRNHVLESIWGSDRLLLSRTVDTHISRLRKKLLLNGESGWRLNSVYRRGYSLQKVI